jgi:hypothetical protein
MNRGYPSGFSTTGGTGGAGGSGSGTVLFFAHDATTMFDIKNISNPKNIVFNCFIILIIFVIFYHKNFGKGITILSNLNIICF